MYKDAITICLHLGALLKAKIYEKHIILVSNEAPTEIINLASTEI